MKQIAFVPARRSNKTKACDRLFRHLQAIEFAEQRGISLDLADIAQLEDTVCRMAKAYVCDGKDVHIITTRYKGQRFTVIFNSRLSYIISIGTARPLVSEPRWMKRFKDNFIPKKVG